MSRLPVKQKVPDYVHSWPQSAMTTFLLVLPDSLPSASIALTTSMPLVTLPKTTCLPSSQLVLTVQRKNYTHKQHGQRGVQRVSV